MIFLAKYLYIFDGKTPIQYQVIGWLFCMVAGYLLGSISSAVIISKKKYGNDIRNFGSGNAGMTNMKRIYGWEGGLLTLAGDVAKQIAAVTVGLVLGSVPGAYLAGTFCVFGHILPIWHGFKGGKGVLTAATMILVLDPKVFGILFVLWVVVLLLSRYVSLASIIAAFAYPAAVTAWYGAATDIFVMLSSLIIGAVVIFMHKDNIKRLFNGKENKFTFKNKKEK